MSDPTHRLSPKFILDRVRTMGPIGLDPCTFKDNPVGASFWFTPLENGLGHGWCGYGLVYVNEPYSLEESPVWSAKVVEAAGLGAEIVRLTKLSGARWSHSSVWGAAQAVCILFKRPHHDSPDGKSTSVGRFDSVVAYYGDRARLFERCFRDIGKVVFL